MRIGITPELVYPHQSHSRWHSNSTVFNVLPLDVNSSRCVIIRVSSAMKLQIHFRSIVTQRFSRSSPSLPINIGLQFSRFNFSSSTLRTFTPQHLADIMSSSATHARKRLVLCCDGTWMDRYVEISLALTKTSWGEINFFPGVCFKIEDIAVLTPSKIVMMDTTNLR